MSGNNFILSSLTSQQAVPISQMNSCRTRIQGKSQAQFIFYINAIMDYLKTSAPPIVAVQVKLVISECVKRNQAGDPSCCPLRRSIVLSIQRCIGPTHWALANLHFKNTHQQHAIYANLKRLQQAPLQHSYQMRTPGHPLSSTCQSLADQIAFLDLFSNGIA